MNSDDASVEVYDLKGLKCPLPVLKARKVLGALPIGAELLVLADDPAAVIDFPYQIARSLLATGLLSGPGSSAEQLLPPISWIAVIALFALFGHYAGGRRTAAIVTACDVAHALFA